MESGQVQGSVQQPPPKTSKSQVKSNRPSVAEEIDLEEIDDRIEALKETFNELVESQNMIFQFKIVSALLDKTQAI